MALGRGYKSTCLGIVQANHYTPIEITDGLENSNLITFENESISQNFARILADWLDGSPAPKADRQGVKSVGGTLTCRMCYDEEEGTNQGIGVGLMLALATQCGLGSSTYAETGYNRYTPANDPSRYITLAFDKDVSEWTCVGVKVSGFRIYGDAASGDVMADFDLRCYDLRACPVWGSGTVGPDHNFAALRADFTTDPTIVAWDDLTFQMDSRGSALSSDERRISSFDFSVDLGLSDDEYATPESSGHTDATLPLEHEGGSKRTTTLSLNMARLDADTYAAWYDDDTALQAEFEFSYSDDYKLWIRIPNAKITAWNANVTGAGPIPQAATLTCYRPNASDTMHAGTHKFEDGSSELLDENSQHVEFGIETLDDRRDDPLAIPAP